MRLWSLHPQYLDPRGLVAVWREGLLAQKVLEGRTRGYRSHPQLLRFKESQDALSNIALFLLEIFEESMTRGYHFDRSRIGLGIGAQGGLISVTDRQVEYEWALLRRKLEMRRARVQLQDMAAADIRVSRVFKVVEGEIENWERVKGGILGEGIDPG